MASKDDHLIKMRLDRIAREKARIEMLRELNLKKYSNIKNDPNIKRSTTNLSVRNSQSTSILAKAANVKSNTQVGKTRPSTVPTAKTADAKPKTETKLINNENIPINNAIKENDKAVSFNKAETTNKTAKPNVKLQIPAKTLVRKSLAPPKSTVTTTSTTTLTSKTTVSSRKTIDPSTSKSATKQTNTRESVFDRLYKPKAVPKKPIDEVQKLKTDPNHLKKMIQNSGLILNKRHTVFENRSKVDPPVRRSISAVHFKRISKTEINNCIHKWSSIGDKLDTVHLYDINEDENVSQDKVVSAVKSERKKVTFLTPVPSKFNTPRPEELQARLKAWLQKHGKDINSYHHLQCFGINHLSKPLQPLHLNKVQLELYDDEDKENVAVQSDSDDDSYTDNMNNDNEGLSGGDKIDIGMDKWRRVSSVSDSVDFNESHNSTLGGIVNHVDELLLGALDDLTELLREGFDWEVCARLLRAIRERFPTANNNAAYWECRAALEERRGDLPASVQCWEEAIVKGTEHSKAEANLDNLLDKFMQLKISPNSGKRRQVDPKMVDVKNVFKSTIIRFAVQKSKLRQSNQQDIPKYTVTPVRRSYRLSVQCSEKRTPLQVCTSVRQADKLTPGHKLVFVPNDKLCDTP